MAVTEAIGTAAAADRRDQLLEQTLVVLSRRSYAETRVEDICASAGVSRATFYRYFDGKDQLFEALVERMMSEVLATAAHLGAVTPDTEGRATLAHWLADLVSITERWGPLVDEVNLLRAGNPHARARAVVMTGRFADLLGERFAAGGVEGVDPTMAALAIIAMTDRTAHQVRTWNIDLDREAVVDALATLAMRMLHPGMPDDVAG
ncbi:MAG TPA: TetR/AcrR family transcriptional regulator [Mycobacteriales bacterium]|nr:TetR/AcrR family transcriptional regulator [Mycobacteriales bacterium]